MLTIENLTKTFPRSATSGAHQALGAVDLTVERGEFFALLGPSGCGKTTLLQCVAGLEAPTSGAISIEGEPVVDTARGIIVPPNRRALGMVFQSYAIWPHLSVFENVAFPLRYGRRREVASATLRDRVMSALELVHLTDLADRPAPNLSGGQQQRVALARAIVDRPRILLLDEPLSNLDAKLRATMRVELRSLIKSLGMTAIFVTHDQDEALAMADRIALMRQGRLEQLGTPTDLFFRPSNTFAASFIGGTNLIPGVLRDDGMIDCAIGIFAGDPAPGLEAGHRVLAVLRPQWIEPVAPAEGEEPLKGIVLARTFLGEVHELAVAIGETRLIVQCDSFRPIEVGAPIALRLSAPRLPVIADDEASVTGGAA